MKLLRNKINAADRCAPADFFVEPVEKVIFRPQNPCIASANLL
jgi:hypothetical protein